MKTNEVEVEDAELESLMEMLSAQSNVNMAIPNVAIKPTNFALPKSLEVKVDVVVEPVEAVVIEESFKAPVEIERVVEVDVPNEVKTFEAYSDAETKGGLDFYVDRDIFKRETAIDVLDLDGCFVDQSSLRAYYGSLAASSQAQYNRQKALFEQLEAKLYAYYRRLALDSGDKATEKSLESSIKVDSRWIAGKNQVIDAEEIAESNKSNALSLVDRREMLIMLGNDRRNEQKGSLRILEERQERDELSVRAANVGKKAFSTH